MYAGNRARSTSTNQNGERTCVEPGELLGSKAARENTRCSVGESVYLQFSTKVLGLESHTLGIGKAKYVAKYKKTANSITNYIERESIRAGPTLQRQ